jgi:hypothetical protein
MTQVIECLLSKLKALSSNSSTAKRKKRRDSKRGITKYQLNTKEGTSEGSESQKKKRAIK